MTPLPTILQIACDVCRVSEAMARSPQTRVQPVVDAKHAFAYLGRLDGHSTAQIGAFLKLGVNTVNERFRTASDRVEFDNRFPRMIALMLARLNPATPNGDHIAFASQWVCDCGEACDPMGSDWRWDGRNWMHQHTARRNGK